MKKTFCFLLLGALLCGCSAQTPITEVTQNTQVIETPKDMFTDRDKRTDAENCYTIVLSDGGSTSDCGSVTVNGNTVTITREANYKISGSLSDGMVIVDTDKNAKVHLILDSTTISNKFGAALYIRQADKVFVTLNGTKTLSA